MKTLLLTILLAAHSVEACAESGSPLKDTWKTCRRDSDCTVIHVNGCPFDSLAVALSYSEEVRTWAELENMRHNCIREAVSQDVKRKMRAHCENGTCAFAVPFHPQR